MRKRLEGKEIGEMEEVKEGGRGVKLAKGTGETMSSEYSRAMIRRISEVVNT